MKIKVIFRRFRDTKEVIALFPFLPWNSYDPRVVTSYLHHGQHGGAVASLTATTLPASGPDVDDLKRELEIIGYDLEVLKRVPPNAYRKRREALAAMR